MTDEYTSNYRRYVMGQTLGKMSVVSVHLWLEHLLSQCLRIVVPNPAALFRDRGMGFAQLVSLCEAHQLIEPSLADLLRRVNALRNKCAHQLTFEPSDEDWRQLSVALDAIAPTAATSAATADYQYDDPLRRLADLLEQKAVAIGAIEGDAAEH